MKAMNTTTKIITAMTTTAVINIIKSIKNIVEMVMARARLLAMTMVTMSMSHLIMMGAQFAPWRKPKNDGVAPVMPDMKRFAKSNVPGHLSHDD
jgi:hypothetical protein